MIFWDYFDQLFEGIELIIAVGSIMGLLGLIVGVMGLLFLGRFQRAKMAKVIFISIVLLAICGISTGVKFFRL